MARTFGDLDQYWEPGLTLTVLGREYQLPLPSAELGLWCRRVAETAGQIHSASTEEEVQAAAAAAEDLPELPGKMSLPERVLGPVYQQMVDDKVPDPYISFCGQTAYVWIIGGEESAERFWMSGGRPEALSPGNRASKRAAAKASTGQTSGGAASGTRSRASTSGTKPRKQSSSSGAAKATRGRKS